MTREMEGGGEVEEKRRGEQCDRERGRERDRWSDRVDED